MGGDVRSIVEETRQARQIAGPLTSSDHDPAVRALAQATIELADEVEAAAARSERVVRRNATLFDGLGA